MFKLEEKKIEDLFEEGEKLSEVGRWEEAEEVFSEILRREPEHDQALNKMGVIYAYRKDKEKATKYFRHSLEIERKNPPALTNLGNIFLEQGEYDQAEALYKEALRYDPDYGTAHNNMAAIYKKRGDLHKMVDSLKKARRAGTMTVSTGDSSSFVNKGCFLVLGALLVILLLIYFIR